MDAGICLEAGTGKPWAPLAGYCYFPSTEERMEEILCSMLARSDSNLSLT